MIFSPNIIASNDLVVERWHPFTSFGSVSSAAFLLYVCALPYVNIVVHMSYWKQCLGDSLCWQDSAVMEYIFGVRCLRAHLMLAMPSAVIAGSIPNLYCVSSAQSSPFLSITSKIPQNIFKYNHGSPMQPYSEDVSSHYHGGFPLLIPIPLELDFLHCLWTTTTEK